MFRQSTHLFILILFTILFSCKVQDTIESDTIENVVGEIFHDPIADGNFEICGAQNQIIQYYAFDKKAFKEEKAALIQYFKGKYIPILNEKKSGLIRIRFIVNCKGVAGRFRILSMNSDYEEIEFSNDVTGQLLNLTKNFNGWKAMQAGGDFRDYYQYLIFKIKDGELIEIMP